MLASVCFLGFYQKKYPAKRIFKPKPTTITKIFTPKSAMQNEKKDRFLCYPQNIHRYTQVITKQGAITKKHFR
jgi:hypothetical protein